MSVGVVADCVCFAAWIGERERGACAGVCRGNEAEEDRELQCKPLLEVEEEEEQEEQEDLSPAAEPGDHPLQYRRDHQAGRTPLGPEIDQDRPLVRRGEHLRLEIAVIDIVDRGIPPLVVHRALRLPYLPSM